MSRLKARFDEPRHGWMHLLLYDEGKVVLHRAVSHLYGSLAELAMALLFLVDSHREERAVTWLEEPREIDMRFIRWDDLVRLEITSVPFRTRPLGMPTPELLFEGTYDEICLPFWRALRSLEGRYKPEELAERWRGYFPHHELGVLTQALGKE